LNDSVELDVFRCALDGINLIEASAGTGKTWNICGLYLRLLLERRLEVQEILVVTFTNSATAELRARIRTRIVETAAYLASGSAQSGSVPSGDSFVPDLVAELLDRHGMDAADIARRLELALQTFDEAAIFTIHGFCQRALADTPFAAGLPMAMELLQDDSELRMEVVHDFWRRHIAGEALSPALAGYLVQKGDSPESLGQLLRRHLAKPLAACLWPNEIDVAADIDGCALAADFQAARATWLSARVEIIDLLTASMAALNGNSYKLDSVQTGAAEWDELFRLADPLAPTGEKLRLYRASVLDARKKKNCVAPAHPFFDEADDYLARREQIDEALTKARLRLIRSLLTEAGAQLRTLKRARRVVSFDDMLFNVYERLTSGDCLGLATSLKSRFPAALIDEFQDTDPLQFEIFRRIYGSANSPFAQPAPLSPLFLVGDPKQAIYSFRNADLHTYLRAREQTTADHSLVANQRSSKGLLAALNALLETNPHAFMLPGLDYQHVEFGKKPRQDFVDQSSPRADLQVWMLPAEEGTPALKKAARRVVAQATAAEIARLINEAGCGRITIAGKPLRPGDIAVLVRSHAQGSEMKRALADLRVGSVELSQASVFQTADAEDVERVLQAILEPARDRLVRAALATELFGCDAAEIEMISNDETRLMKRIIQFTEYRDLWLRRGFGVMYRRVLSTERVAIRMLSRPDGERRLTNFLHLGESLHQASEANPSPELLLRFLEAQRRDGSSDDAAQLRLESDQNLVQIVTIHKSKGLEYPVVFCPFLWDGRTSFGGREPEGAEYHDDEGLPVIDFRGELMDKAELDAIKQKRKLEQSAEMLRLIYVALTRAMHRCYLVAGCYSAKSFSTVSATESTRSMLNWLVAGATESPQAWFGSKLTVAAIDAAWAALATRSGPCINVAPLPAALGMAIADNRPDPETLTVLAAPSHIPDGWRLSSYSGLSHGAISEQAASDHDARVGVSSGAIPVQAEIEVDDILRFPRGAAAGECIHAVFETSDFADPGTWESAVARALASHPQTLAGLPDAIQRERLSRMLLRLLRDVTAAELIDGLRLNAIPLCRRLTELEFNLPARDLKAATLNDALKRLGYAGPTLTFGAINGYLKGFIDLVFEHQGRFFILDWKSNHLGHDPASYSAEPLAEAMADHGYHLQHILYTVALDRYLRRRIPGYNYESHFGGVLYLFIRGVRPSWRNADGSASGVVFHRIDPGALRQFDALLDASPPGATRS
jgi:exodeoxyribonuclease V beta subunit